jgi:hypothetical protein
VRKRKPGREGPTEGRAAVWRDHRPTGPGLRAVSLLDLAEGGVRSLGSPVTSCVPARRDFGVLVPEGGRSVPVGRGGNRHLPSSSGLRLEFRRLSRVPHPCDEPQEPSHPSAVGCDPQGGAAYSFRHDEEGRAPGHDAVPHLVGPRSGLRRGIRRYRHRLCVTRRIGLDGKARTATRGVGKEGMSRNLSPPPPRASARPVLPAHG